MIKEHGRDIRYNFTTRIAESRQDKKLEMKLRQEAGGIFNWLLEGAARWKRERLQTPAVILNATDEYLGEMDVIGSFLKERCKTDFDAAIRIMKKCFYMGSMASAAIRNTRGAFLSSCRLSGLLP